MRRGLESGDALWRRAFPRCRDAVRPGDAERPRPRPGGQPAGPVPPRLPGDAGRGLPRRPGHGQRPAPADAAVRHAELAAARPRAWGALAALPGGEVWLQEPEARRADPL